LSFQAAADYCLACSDESSEGDYDPTRECFVAVIGEPGDDDDVAADAARAAMAAAGPAAVPGPSTPANVAEQQAQLVQLRELEAKVDEDHQQTQKLRHTLEQGHTGHGTGARESGRVAREWILAEDGEGSPLALPKASQKITAAALLIRAMPEPSSPEGRNLRKEAQVLLEEAAVQQVESSASRLRSVASTRADEATRQDHEASVHTPPANRAKAPSVHDRVKPTPVKD